MISVQTNTLTNNTPFVAKQLTIKSSAAAFKILSSSMYERKSEAVLRELAANGLDSHLGYNEATPIEITLPTELEPQLVVQDFGIGMSLSTVNNVYNEYFSSTKTDNNNDIGGFGIGSKTPFAISDSYTVVTTHEGTTTTLIMAIGENGPVCNIMSSVHTEEPSGTTVTVPVDNMKFISDMKQAALSLFKYWPIQPNIKGLTLEQADTSKLLSTRHFVEGKYRYSGSFSNVLIGPFVYAIPESLVDELNISSLPILKNLRGVILSTAIGELEIAPSRERIEDTIANRSILKKLIIEVQKLLTDKEEETHNKLLSVITTELGKDFVIPDYGLTKKQRDITTEGLTKVLGCESLIEMNLRYAISKYTDKTNKEFYSAYPTIYSLITTDKEATHKLRSMNPKMLTETTTSIRRGIVWNCFSTTIRTNVVLTHAGLTNSQKQRINSTLRTNGSIKVNNSNTLITIDNYIEIETTDPTQITFLIKECIGNDVVVISYSDIEDNLLEPKKPVRSKVGIPKKAMPNSEVVLTKTARIYPDTDGGSNHTVTVGDLYYSDKFDNLDIVIELRKELQHNRTVQSIAEYVCKTKNTIVIRLTHKESRTKRFEKLLTRPNVTVFDMGSKDKVISYFLGNNTASVRALKTVYSRLYLDSSEYFNKQQTDLFNLYKEEVTSVGHSVIRYNCNAIHRITKGCTSEEAKILYLLDNDSVSSSYTKSLISKSKITNAINSLYKNLKKELP